MPRAKKGQQKLPNLKKTTVVCPSRSYYSMVITYGAAKGKEGGRLDVELGIADKRLASACSSRRKRLKLGGY